MTLALDHLVVTAPTLEAGVRWCQATLGVTPGPGGKHPLMGTHNRLVNITSEGFTQAYLEIIAIDPAAPRPPHTRWFGLDTLTPESTPQLQHLVLRCDHIKTTRAAMLAAGQDPGLPTAASRDTPQGRLQWLISVRADGGVLAQGAPATLIEWQCAHPSAHMADVGVRLASLSLAPGAMALPVAGAISQAGPAISATIRCPRGHVTLHTP